MRYIIILIIITFMTFLALEIISGTPEVHLGKAAWVNLAPHTMTMGDEMNIVPVETGTPE